MTPQEFKAWFDGYTEDMDGRPTSAQWDRIKARVKEINGVPISYPWYVQHYQPYITPYVGAVSSAGNNTVALSNAAYQNSITCRSNIPQNAGFDSHTAMHALGKAEAVTQ